MTGLKTEEKWIQEGYKYFAEVGPLNFSIKRLSDRTGLTRTSFNYYFGNKNEFFHILLDKHFYYINEFNSMVKKERSLSVQKLGEWMDEFTDGIRFQHKLFSHRHIEVFDKAYIRGHEINIHYGLLDWLIEHLNLKISAGKARRVYFMVTDVFFTRCNDFERMKSPELTYSEIFIQTFEDFLILLDHRV